MATWLKLKVKERKVVAMIKDDDIITIPDENLSWIDYPSQIDLEVKRIVSFQPLVVEDYVKGSYTQTSATLIMWTDESSSYAAYEYNDFKEKILPKYNKLIDGLDVVKIVAERIVSGMSDEEIGNVLYGTKQ
jgi:hypothetical protein